MWWNSIFNLKTEDWKIIYKLPYSILKSTRLQWFQTRINQRIIGTNWLLNKIDNNNNPNCSFCNNETESIEHLFWDGEHIKTLFQLFLQTIRNKNIELKLTKQNFILGIFHNLNKNRINNVIIIWIKYYIYKTKLRIKIFPH